MNQELADLELRHAATDHATIVTVPERRMFALDGVGAPSGTDHRASIETLHDVADRVRALVARTQRVQTRLGPIECAWWMHPEPPPDEVAREFEDRSTWHWQLMTEIPERADDGAADAAIAESRAARVDHAEHIHVIRFVEGRSAQILHVGGPRTAGAAIARLYAEVAAAGGHPHGHIHEIHLTDPRHVPPDRQRVILRLPIEATATR